MSVVRTRVCEKKLKFMTISSSRDYPSMISPAVDVPMMAVPGKTERISSIKLSTTCVSRTPEKPEAISDQGDILPQLPWQAKGLLDAGI